MTKIRTRFAPSPTGYMHIGNLRTALYGYMYAKFRGGDFILRIEDTDQKRLASGAIELIISTMREAGLGFDEGPFIGGPCGPYIQSQRKQIYKEHAELLVAKGAAYCCFCSPERLKNIQGEAGTHRYDRLCLSLTQTETDRRKATGEPYCIRQKMPDTGISRYQDAVYGEIIIENKELEDNVLLKSDGHATYNFANVVDDHLMDINCVIRGCEYLSSTPKYNLLYEAFGWEKPMYIHLPPINKDKQRKLSKRNGDASYGDLIAKGFLKDAILNYIALLGWSPKNNAEKMTLDEMMKLFGAEGINKSPAIFDPLKLRWLNGLYIKEMTPDAFYEYAKPYLAKCKTSGKYDERKLCALVQGRIETFEDIAEKVDFLEEFGQFDAAIYVNEKQKSDAAVAKTVLPEIIKVLDALPNEEWSNAKLYETLKALAQGMGLKASQVLWSCRVAVSAREATAGGATELCELLGKKESLKRLKFSLKLL